MKVRSGFVSNSSSCSFVCDICKHSASGWDIWLNDAYMVQCVKGHTVCDGHVDIDAVKVAFVEKWGPSPEDDDEWRDSVPSELCPICNYTVIPKADVVDHLLIKYDLNIDDVENEMRDNRENCSRKDD